MVRLCRMSPLRRLPLLLLLPLVALLDPHIAQADNFDGKPKILLHVRGVTSKSQCDPNGVQLNDCIAATTSGNLAVPDVGPYYFVYLMASKGDLPTLGGIECGITYQGGAPGAQLDGQGLDVYSWTSCYDTQLGAGWPAPGSGIVVRWAGVGAPCQSVDPYLAGYFYVGAYGADEIRVTERPVSGRAAMSTCCIESFDLGEADLGIAAFSAGATDPGCNPCNNPCEGSPAPPHAPPMACDPEPGAGVGDPKLLLHLTPPVSSSACANGDLLDCRNAVVEGTSSPGGSRHFAYIVANRGDIRSINMIRCGIDYQAGAAGGRNDQEGLDVLSWSYCSPFEDQGPGWPAPGASIVLSWEEFDCDVQSVKVAGYFYLSAYGADELTLTPHGSDQAVTITSCAFGPERALKPGDVGRLAFSPDGSADGCNPCLTDCGGAVNVTPTSWSAIKRLVR